MSGHDKKTLMQIVLLLLVQMTFSTIHARCYTMREKRASYSSSDLSFRTVEYVIKVQTHGVRDEELFYFYKV
jgi:hypothetical protein